MHWAESFHMQLHPTSNIHDMAAKLFAESDPNQFRYTTNCTCCRCISENPITRDHNLAGKKTPRSILPDKMVQAAAGALIFPSCFWVFVF
jgi:hypothetical protein